jgi:predicted aspartyl protease
MRRVICTLWFGFVRLSLLSAPTALASTAFAAQGTDSIRLPLSIIQSNPVTTITVGERTVQAIIDTGGGALMLSKEVLDSVSAISLGDSVVSTDASGREFEHRRFRVPVATIGGHAFHDIVAIQASDARGPPVPNSIGRQFLSRYFVVVDYAGATITLWPANTKDIAQTTCGRKRLPMLHTVEDNQLAVGDFATEFGHIRLLLDTGATYSELPETIAEKLQLPTTVRGPGSPQFYQSKVLSASGQDFGPLEFVLLPLKLSGDFGGMLGRNFFERHVVCLDYERREIRIR